MKPVFQTKFFEDGVSRGDCLRACIASITQLTYEELPHSIYMCDYYELLCESGYDMDNVEALEEIDCEGLDGFYIGAGPAVRGCRHAVIIDRKGNLIHDPHPSGLGLISLERIYIIKPMEHIDLTAIQ